MTIGQGLQTRQRFGKVVGKLDAEVAFNFFKAEFEMADQFVDYRFAEDVIFVESEALGDG